MYTRNYIRVYINYTRRRLLYERIAVIIIIIITYFMCVSHAAYNIIRNILHARESYGVFFFILYYIAGTYVVVVAIFSLRKLGHRAGMRERTYRCTHAAHAHTHHTHIYIYIYIILINTGPCALISNYYYIYGTEKDIILYVVIPGPNRARVCASGERFHQTVHTVTSGHYNTPHVSYYILFFFSVSILYIHRGHGDIFIINAYST